MKNFGVSQEYYDFVQFKVNNMDGDFQENLKEFINKNEYVLKKEFKKDTGISGVTVKADNDAEMMAQAKAFRPDVF